MGPCLPAFAIWGAKMPLCLICPCPLAEWAFSIVVPASCRMSFCDLASLKGRVNGSLPSCFCDLGHSNSAGTNPLIPAPCRMSFFDRGSCFLPDELFRSWAVKRCCVATMCNCIYTLAVTKPIQNFCKCSLTIMCSQTLKLAKRIPNFVKFVKDVSACKLHRRWISTGAH